MRYFLLCCLYTSSLLAQSFDLKSGSGVYEVKHLIKRVKGESHELKGKMNCSAGQCELLVAAPVKSFVSSDANRDSNMLTLVESGKFPLVTARSSYKAQDLALSSFELSLEVDFHGIKKTYQAQVQRKEEGSFKTSFILSLSQHQVERPSLFGVSIDDQVPMVFETIWVQNKN